MKKRFSTSLMTFLGLFLLTFALTSCLNDDEREPLPPVTEAEVNGKYEGKLVTIQAQIRNEKVIKFVASDAEMTFEELPIKEIVSSVISDPLKVNEAVTAIGKVPYKIAYTRKLLSSSTIVELKLTPQAINLEVPVDGTTKTVVATVTTKQPGYYGYINGQKGIIMELHVEKLEVDGVELSTFEPIIYSFPRFVKSNTTN